MVVLRLIVESVILLAPLKHFHASVSADVVQIFVLFHPCHAVSVPRIITTAVYVAIITIVVVVVVPSPRDPQHAAHIVGSARVQQPQRHDSSRGVRHAQHEGRVLALERRRLRRNEGLVGGEGDDGRVELL